MRPFGHSPVIFLVLAAAAGAAGDEPLPRAAAIANVIIETTGPDVPRADFGSVVEFPGGKLMVAYMRYAPNKKGSSDFGLCNITCRFGKPAWQNLSLHAMIVARSWFLSRPRAPL